jgi:hypothetical protein
LQTEGLITLKDNIYDWCWKLALYYYSCVIFSLGLQPVFHIVTLLLGVISNCLYHAN